MNSKKIKRYLDLIDKIKMFLMIKEQYDGIDIVELPNKKNTYIDKKRAFQLYIAYLYVVIESLKSIEKNYGKFDCLERFNQILNKEYAIGIDSECLRDILRKYRNKTFHSQDNSYYNQKELFNFDIIFPINEIHELVEIISRLPINDIRIKYYNNFYYYNGKYFELKNNNRNVGEINE